MIFKDISANGILSISDETVLRDLVDDESILAQVMARYCEVDKQLSGSMLINFIK